MKDSTACSIPDDVYYYTDGIAQRIRKCYFPSVRLKQDGCRPLLGISDMRHEVFLDSTGHHEVFLNSTGRHEFFLNSTGRQYPFL